MVNKVIHDGITLSGGRAHDAPHGLLDGGGVPHRLHQKQAVGAGNVQPFLGQLVGRQQALHGAVGVAQFPQGLGADGGAGAAVDAAAKDAGGLQPVIGFAAQDAFAPSQMMPETFARVFTMVWLISSSPPPSSQAIPAPAPAPAVTAPQ